jgi:DNA-binding MarR family transcriptional regulator
MRLICAYTRLLSRPPKHVCPVAADTSFPQCNCLALRQAARHITQFYDQYLSPSGLRTTQFSILAKLKRMGPMTINALARELVMDRTTLGRTMLPLERDGLIAINEGTIDRRSKELVITKSGAAQLQRAAKLWTEAQKDFEERFGTRRAGELRGLLAEVVSCELGQPAAASTLERKRPSARL